MRGLFRMEAVAGGRCWLLKQEVMSNGEQRYTFYDKVITFCVHKVANNRRRPEHKAVDDERKDDASEASPPKITHTMSTYIAYSIALFPAKLGFNAGYVFFQYQNSK